MHVTAHANGLVLITLLTGDHKRRFMVARTHFQFDPDEGTPRPATLLLRAAEELTRELVRREG